MTAAPTPAQHLPMPPRAVRAPRPIGSGAPARYAPWRVPWYLWGAAGLSVIAALEAKAPQVLHRYPLLLVLAGVVLLALVGAILWELPPAAMVCGGLVLTMFSGNWKAMGLPGFPFVPDRILLAVALLALALRSPGAVALPPIRVRAVHLLMLVLILYAAASGLLVGTLGERSAIFGLMDRVGAIPFLMFFLAPVIFPGKRERNWLLATLVGIGAYLGPTAIFESVGPHTLVFPHYIWALDVVRNDGQATGPFSAVVSEGFACYACAIAAAIAFAQWRGAWRWFAGAVAPVAMFGSFLSLERGVWIGTVAGALAVALVAPEVRRWLIPAGAICAVVLAGVLTLSLSLGAATSSRYKDPYPIWDRQNQTAAALRMVQAKPLFGFGWNNYVNTASGYFRLSPNIPLTGYPSSLNRQALGGSAGTKLNGSGQTAQVGLTSLTLELHNTYLEYAVELGLVGACLWLACVVWGLGGSLLAAGAPELRPWRLGLLALTVCFLVLAAVDPFDQNFVEFSIWTWAGVVAAGACGGGAGSVVTEPVAYRGPPATGSMTQTGASLPPARAPQKIGPNEESSAGTNGNAQ